MSVKDELLKLIENPTEPWQRAINAVHSDPRQGVDDTLLMVAYCETDPSHFVVVPHTVTGISHKCLLLVEEQGMDCAWKDSYLWVFNVIRKEMQWEALSGNETA